MHKIKKLKIQDNGTIKNKQKYVIKNVNLPTN